MLRPMPAHASSPPRTFLGLEGPLPIAHRGGAAERPENTMAAFEHAVDLGCRTHPALSIIDSVSSSSQPNHRDWLRALCECLDFSSTRSDPDPSGMPRENPESTMLVICTATTPNGTITHHLVRADTGAEAYRRLRPLLTPNSHIETTNLNWWIQSKRGPIPQGLRALDPIMPEERARLEATGGMGSRTGRASLPAGRGARTQKEHYSPR